MEWRRIIVSVPAVDYHPPTLTVPSLSLPFISLLTSVLLITKSPERALFRTLKLICLQLAPTKRGCSSLLMDAYVKQKTLSISAFITFTLVLYRPTLSVVIVQKLMMSFRWYFTNLIWGPLNPKKLGVCP